MFNSLGKETPRLSSYCKQHVINNKVQMCALMMDSLLSQACQKWFLAFCTLAISLQMSSCVILSISPENTKYRKKMDGNTKFTKSLVCSSLVLILLYALFIFIWIEKNSVPFFISQISQRCYRNTYFVSRYREKSESSYYVCKISLCSSNNRMKEL